jgi:hypothetical protein
MPEFQLKTPVAFIIFNRPDTTERVFGEIAKAKPPKLFVISDGPRIDRAGEADKVKAARAIIDRVDWVCEVLTNYSDENLGCKRRVSSGLDWVFEMVEEAIILEDDCLPHPTFFRFCEELLKKYRGDEKVAMVSGDNFQAGHRRDPHSYYFSRYTHIWGWATWRRAWRRFDPSMGSWPERKSGRWLKEILDDSVAEKYWQDRFDEAYTGKVNAWSLPWLLACWSQGGLTIMPNVNLISNIGFGVEATHSKVKDKFADMPVTEMSFPLSHPPEVIRDHRADKYTEKTAFSGKRPPLRQKVAGSFRQLIRSIRKRVRGKE